MLSSFKLHLKFDPIRLLADLDRISSTEWLPHFNTLHYEDGWSGIALRSVAGSTSDLQQTHGSFADTTILLQCPYFQRVLATFKCPIERVRLLKLSSGGVINEHIDPLLGYDYGKVRVHIPIVTNTGVEFFVERKRVVMARGEAWYIDASFPHRVANLGQTDRIHLVFDCVVNNWIRSIIPTDLSAPRWQRLLAYKLRRLRFRFKDIGRLIKKEPRAFRRRLLTMLHCNMLRRQRRQG